MVKILTDLSTSSLAVSTKANLYAFFKSFRHSSVATAQDVPYGYRFHTLVKHPLFNGILVQELPRENAEQAVRNTLTFFQSHDVASFLWWHAPHLDQKAWDQVLLPQGFQYHNETPGMAMDLADLPQAPIQSSLTVCKVEAREGLTEWGRVFVRGYGLPESMGLVYMELMKSLGLDLPFRHYTGYLDGDPVATSTLFLGAGVAGIYNVATVEEARGRGFGSAMTIVPLYEAREMGYHAAILQSTSMGYSVYQRLGFREVCRMDQYHWLAEVIHSNS